MGGRGDCTGVTRTPQTDRGPQSGACRRRGFRQETPPLSSRPRETTDAPAQFGVCTPPRALALAQAGLQVITHLEEGMSLLLPTHPLCSVKRTPHFLLHPSSLQTTLLSQAQRGRRGLPAPKPTGNSAQKAREESFKRPWNSCQSTRWRRCQSQQASRNSPALLCAKS